MPTDGQINITDPQGILLITGVVLAYLVIRLFPRFLVGFGNYLSAA